MKQRNDTIDTTPQYVMPEAYDDTSKPEARSRRYKVLDSRYDVIDDKVELRDTDVHEGLQVLTLLALLALLVQKHRDTDA